ncbi:MAG: FAD:protein FMN transferase [Actinobacteria bacterium]|nr:FAD:protein FMN transferase [Actinomycetota bacterium]
MSATASWRALGTSATVATAAADALPAARAAVERELAAIDLACSRFRDDSELTALNAAAGAPVPVSPLLAQAVAVALRAARATGGVVDPTLGAELVRAGYDRDFGELAALSAGQAPAARAAGEAGSRGVGAGGAPRRRPAWPAVRLDRARGTVTLPAGVALDLGATAKALAADRAARAAHAAAGCGVLVSLGGDVAVAGPAPGDGWAIRVTEDHAAPAEAAGQVVTIPAGGLATSGTTVRRWQAGGVPRHHLLDPRTGEPAAVVWRTASVAAASCVDANTASTAAIVLGASAAPWLLRHGLPARLVSARGRVLLIGAWPRRLPQERAA